MSRLELVVFDWDGTLSDSAARIVTTMQLAFREHDLEPPADETVRRVVGLGLEIAVARLAPQLDATKQRQLVATYRKVYFTDAVPASPLFAGAYETVAALADAGYLLAVATGKGRSGLEHGLSESGLGEFFAVTRCADETRSKPHPQMLNEILTDLDTVAARAVMVGDTEFDLEMAHAAGTHAAAVTYGVHPLERLLASSPHLVVDHIESLPGALSDYAEQEPAR